ncbi:MAG: fatty acid desaturase [Minicystis sp.]
MPRADALPAATSTAKTAAPLAVLRMWALHLISLALPLYVLAFLLTGPHRWFTSLPWLAVVALLFQLDKRSGPALHKPVEGAPAWPFDLILLALAAVQLASVVLAARLIGQAGLFSADTLVTVVLVGLSSGVSAIVVAHELIHRRERWMMQLGRVLLCSVFYEHFATEHVRGHHARLGTAEDPATSRFGESYRQFWRRTVPGQLRSAYRIEAKRLGDEDMTWSDPRVLRNSVVHGVLAETVLAAVLFALVGLSRHADHHAYAARPFQALRTWEESPKLPHGYVVTTLMVIFANKSIRAELDAELARRRLGPFAEA